MPKKPRYGLFSVGRSKTSPARAASTKRASIRRSVIHTEAPQLLLDFGAAGRGTDGSELATTPEDEGPNAVTRESLQNDNEPRVHDMKDTPLPPVPTLTTKTRELVPLPHTDAHSSRPPRSEMPPSRQAGPSRTPEPSVTIPTPRPPQAQTGLFKRFTSKLRSSSPSRQNTQPSRQAPQNNPQRKHTILRMPPKPAVAPPVANDFTNVEQRRAALLARGLIPATAAVPSKFRDADGFMMTLSEQEAEIDRRRAVVVPRQSTSEEEGESEAKKIREAWLAKQDEAGAPSSSSHQTQEEETPRKSDAMERASKDGTIGQKSPIRATFVHATTLPPYVAEVGDGSENTPGSPLEATVDDFHTAPNTPAKFDGRRPSVDRTRAVSPEAPTRRASLTPSAPTSQRDPPESPSSHSSAVTEKVSRWLRTSNDAPPSPTHPSALRTQSPVDPALSTSPRPSLSVRVDERASAAPPRSPRKDKPPPIIVTSHRPSQDAKVPAQVISVAIAAPTDSNASASDGGGRPSLEARGRQAPTTPPPKAESIPLSQSMSTSTERSRTTTVPALSPTRTVSSSGAESCLPTPTMTSTSLARDPSISRGSTSHSSDGGHEAVSSSRARRGAAGGELKTKTKTAGAPVIMEEYSETEPSSEGGEFGVLSQPQQQSQAVTQGGTAPTPADVLVRMPVPRPAAAQADAAVKQQNRKSFSLFGKKSLDLPPKEKDARMASSMSNLRRAFTSATKSKAPPRPKSSVDEVTVAEMGRKRSKMFDASHLPMSPTRETTFAPGAPSGARAAELSGRAPGVGPRPPRQAVAPTMHSRGSILLQAHGIEDEESRRLSEMAFLT